MSHNFCSASDGDRLFFILFYMKTCPLQEVTAVLFGMSLSQADTRIHRLSGVLKRAPGEGQYLPERDPSASEEALKKCPGLSFVADGTEREIQRPKEPEKQIIFYSGRKKTHTVKNIVIADAVSKKVIFPSRTCGGKKHDRIGGVAIYPGFFLPFVSVLFYSAQILDLLTLDKQMVHLILGASTVFGLGVIDDVRRAGTQAEICGSDCRRSGRILRSVPPPFSRVCTG